MKLDSNIIAIAGNARTGKDTLGNNFVKILNEQGIKAKTFSFANELKESVNKFVIDQTGISAFTENKEEKNLIRPFLVCWGTDVMRKINNNIWIEKLSGNLLGDHVNIITDLRFANELKWIKETNGLSLLIKRDGINPANPYEEEQNKILEDEVGSVFHMANLDDENVMMLTANEILNSMITKDIYQKWKATCHS
jgi:AAA+ ATPase superfamily predicted ATPase